MSNLTLFEIVLIFATISSAVIVFLLQRIIDSDSKWLDLAKTCLIKSDMLSNILLKHGETIRVHNARGNGRNFDAWVSMLNEDMETFKNGEIAINDNSKYISPYLYDNIIDIMTASVLRLRNLIAKYFEGFVAIYGEASYATKFYEVMFKRLKYKRHSCLKIFLIVLIIATIILLLISFGCTLSINNIIYQCELIALWILFLLAVLVQTILLSEVIKTIKVRMSIIE